ncbi:hypothetical protein JTE90_005774 [Oedothorax gibbosus]|uniref:Uncharacterized protein n=1 Tax=Oedothorax gibbosus TaxID=931172 RepID=A0AAV6US28_9ARAC|nr:hypothetical protein JTE90_005774 [Oedothorax gibbosus]
MEKDLVASGTNENEATPLLTPRVNVQVLVKKGDEVFSVKKTELSNLSSELSGLKLEPSSQATTKPVDEPILQQQEPTESPTVEGGDITTDAVEDMSIDQIIEEIDQVLGEIDTTPAPPVNSPLEEEVLTESPDESESGNRRCGWLMDSNARWLILEVILLAFPISMTYYGVANYWTCPGGDKLPTLLLFLAIFSLTTLTCRIVCNIARVFKTSYDEDIVPPTVIVAGEFLVVVFYIAEVSYIFTMDVALCDEDFYEYIVYMNNIAALFICILIIVHIQKLYRCIRILRE